MSSCISPTITPAAAVTGLANMANATKIMSRLKGVERFQQVCWSSSTQLTLLMLQTPKITGRPTQWLKIVIPLAWFLLRLLTQQFFCEPLITPLVIQFLCYLAYINYPLFPGGSVLPSGLFFLRLTTSCAIFAFSRNPARSWLKNSP